jgi:hypothetical protein
MLNWFCGEFRRQIQAVLGSLLFVAVVLLCSAAIFAQDSSTGRSMDAANVSVRTIADLKSLIARPNLIYVAGHMTPDDGGGGLFYWLPGDQHAFDDALVVRPAAGPPGNYKRIVHEAGTYNAKWFGAVCDGRTNVAQSVIAAKAAGARKIILGARCLYSPLNNQTPADLVIRGEDPATSIVAVGNRTTDRVYMGPRSVLENLAIVSYDCDVGVEPQGVAKVCPLNYAANISDSPRQLINWVYEGITYMSGPKVTGPTGVTSRDLPLVALLGYGDGGDNLYTATFGSGTSGVRALTSGDGDIGVFILNGMDVPTTKHYGIYIKDFSDGKAGQLSQRISRIGGSTALQVDDVGAKRGLSNDMIRLLPSQQTSGNLVFVRHTESNFAGTVTHFDMGNGGGDFTGYFERFDVAGANRWSVDHEGNVRAAGRVTIGNVLRMPPKPPSHSASPCSPGEVTWGGDRETNYVYVCVRDAKWQRIELADF